MPTGTFTREPVSTFAIRTVGCKVNQYDGQVIREHMAQLGWRERPIGERADVYIINTCTVTARADEKCRKAIRRAIRRNQDARVIVTGCGAVRAPTAFASIAGVSAVLTREQMVHVEEFLATGSAPKPGDIFARGISRFADHTRAFLKIQDGCDAHCAYCIVPLVRGRPRSRSLDEVRREAERLVAAGHVEIVLTGIHVGRYDPGGGIVLADAVRETLKTAGLHRLRISSIEATEVTEALLDTGVSDERFCPHFHLPLQSGDDDILATMRRSYTAARFLNRIDTIRRRFPRPSISTDIMVGFPGETEAQFRNTLAVCRAAGFSRIHIFPFSPRPGTPAAEMADRIRAPVIHERESALRTLAAELALGYKRSFLGETVLPLVEHRRERESGRLAGWSPRYLRVEFDGPDALMGRIVPVRVQAAMPDKVLGEAHAGE